MKKLILFASFCILTFSVFAQGETAKQIFKSPDLASFVVKTKTVAILPFKVSISYKKNAQRDDFRPDKRK